MKFAVLLLTTWHSIAVIATFEPNNMIFSRGKHPIPTRHENGEYIKFGNELQLFHPENIIFTKEYLSKSSSKYNSYVSKHEPRVFLTSNQIKHTFNCEAYTASNTNSATQNYVTCLIPNVCQGETLTISDCSDTCVGDQQYKLFENSSSILVATGNQGCTTPSKYCVSGSYTYIGEGCTTLSLHQGCYGSNSCSGVFTVVINFPAVNGPSFEITDVSPLIISNDDIITVSFKSSSPSAKDWIAAYAPVPDNLLELTSISPVKYGYCDEDSNYLKNGFGSLTFNMTNLRSSIGFVYYTGSLSSPVFLNVSSFNVNFKQINEPLRPRVTPTGNPNILNLTWSSASSTQPTLKWGVISGGPYSNIVQASTKTIAESSLCGAPANSYGWRDVGLIHTASFMNVKSLANQNIYYVFGDEGDGLFSGEQTLHVPPSSGEQPPNRPTTVILYDDMGRGSTDMTYTFNEYGRPAVYTAMAVGAEVLNGSIDAIYHGGDLSYANGYMSVWDFWLDMVSPIASRVVYLSTVGNHESDSPGTTSLSTYTSDGSGGECSIPALTLFPQPTPATIAYPWWSYDIGLIHFVGMSTEHNYSKGSNQYAFLENDLKNVDHKITPWVIFGGHRAMYLNSDYCGTVQSNGQCQADSDIAVMNLLIQEIEPLLYKYKVNMAFWGHNHVYNRQAAVFNKTVVQRSVNETLNGEIVHMQKNAQATVHFVLGTAGADFTMNAVTPPPSWNELFYYRWGYLKVSAINASFLDLKWINSETHAVDDHVVITQDDPLMPFGGYSKNESDKSTLSTTAIVLISVLIPVGCFALFCFLYSRKGNKQEDSMNDGLMA